MGRKYTYEEVKDYINSLGYELISKEYLGNGKKLIIKDNLGYYYSPRFSDIKSGKSPDRFNVSNPYTIQNIKLWCKTNNKSFKLISEEYVGSGEKLKWECLEKECQEEFDMNWENIKYGKNCSFCSGKKVGLSNCLATINPKLAKEWHPIKNGSLTPYNVTKASSKEVWWQCEKGHEWETYIYNRHCNDSGCPYCAGQKPTEENNLLICSPNLASEWDYERNDKLPSEFTPNSSRYAYWICTTNPKHKWSATISSRSRNNGDGNGCPYCSGHLPSEDYNLLLIELSICKEWNYEKNDKRPEEYTPHSGEKVWWKCADEGCKYEWEASIYDRTRKDERISECPECKRNKRYRFLFESAQKIMYKFGFELLNYEPTTRQVVLKDLNGYIYSSYLEDIKNGKQPSKFHTSNPYTIKNIKLWLLINKQEYKLVTEKYLGIEEKLTFKDSCEYYYTTTLSNLVNNKSPEKFSVSNDYTIQNIKLWCKLENKPFELISSVYNGNIDYLQWQCLKEGCREIFESSWGNTYTNKGCPYCSGHQVGLSNCLATKNPDLASEWHPTLNGKLTPWDITSGSNEYVWWQCKDNPKHEWNVRVNIRNSGNTGCPYCSGLLSSGDYNLLISNPELCKEWNYEKNDKLPNEYTPMSGESVWWKCKEGHEWNVKISSRNSKNSGCPECAESKGEKRSSKYFNSNNYNYIPQKTFNNLRGVGNGLLSYDFYLPEYNLLYEYQGQYHDGTAGNQTKEEFKIQKEHDRRKKEDALQNGYNFLEIWYWYFDKIEEILEMHLNNF